MMRRFVTTTPGSPGERSALILIRQRHTAPGEMPGASSSALGVSPATTRGETDAHRPSQARPRARPLRLRPADRRRPAVLAAGRRGRPPRGGVLSATSSNAAPAISTSTRRPWARRQMYELSGHWENFADDMFPPMVLGGDELVLRPSLCPHHALIFKSRQRSYRDLPLRIAELGADVPGRALRACSAACPGCARSSSTTRTSSARPTRSATEVAEVLRLMRRRTRRSACGRRRSGSRCAATAASTPGDEAMWARAERLLRDALDDAGISVRGGAGRGRLLRAEDRRAGRGRRPGGSGPCPPFRSTSTSRSSSTWHTSTRPASRSRPVMVHRSLAGSMERLFGHLIEVHAGAFPVWYAPVQVDVLPISRRAGRRRPTRSRRAAIEAGLRAEVHHDGLGRRADPGGGRAQDPVRRRSSASGEAADGLVALRPARRTAVAGRCRRRRRSR